ITRRSHTPTWSSVGRQDSVEPAHFGIPEIRLPADGEEVADNVDAVVADPRLEDAVRRLGNAEWARPDTLVPRKPVRIGDAFDLRRLVLRTLGSKDERNDDPVVLAFHQESDVGVPVAVEVADTAGQQCADPTRLDHAKHVARVDVLTVFRARDRDGLLHDIEWRKPLEHGLRGGWMRRRDTEAAFREAIHAVYALRDASAECHDAECEDGTPRWTRSTRNDSSWARQLVAVGIEAESLLGLDR